MLCIFPYYNATTAITIVLTSLLELTCKPTKGLSLFCNHMHLILLTTPDCCLCVDSHILNPRNHTNFMSGLLYYRHKDLKLISIGISLQIARKWNICKDITIFFDRRCVIMHSLVGERILQYGQHVL